MSEQKITPDTLSIKERSFSQENYEDQLWMLEDELLYGEHIEELAAECVWIETEIHAQQGASIHTLSDILSEGEEVDDWMHENVNIDAFEAIGAGEVIEEVRDKLRDRVSNRAREIWKAMDVDKLVEYDQMDTGELKSEVDELSAVVTLLENEIQYREEQ